MSFHFTTEAAHGSPDVHFLRIVGHNDPQARPGTELLQLERDELVQLKHAVDSYLDGIIVCGNCGQFKRSHPDVGCAWPFFTPTNDPDPEGTFAREQLGAGRALVALDPKAIHDHGDGSHWIVDGPVQVHMFEAAQ